MVIVINSVIGGLSWVDLLWLAASTDYTVRLQLYRMIVENEAADVLIAFEEIVMVMINTGMTHTLS